MTALLPRTHWRTHWRTRSQRGLAILLGALSLGVSFPACTKQAANTAASSADLPVIKLGSPVFHFDYQKTQSLTIDKSDPASGDHWMARVERVRQDTKSFYNDDVWKIASYSDNAALGDRMANRTLILHLLDTLSTLHPVAVVSQPGASAPSGDIRANYGLNPPRYALQWKAWDDQAGAYKTYQVEIGASVAESRDTNRLAYGMFPPDTGIYKLDGAALPMLEYIKTFAVLREQVLSSLSADEVDEVQIRRPGHAEFYAQRDGYVWANRAHHPWKKDVQGFLDRVTHLRVENFIDDPGEASHYLTSLDHHWLAEITLKDHFSRPMTLRLARSGSRAIAQVSTRPGAVFELYPGALSPLSP